MMYPVLKTYSHARVPAKMPSPGHCQECGKKKPRMRPSRGGSVVRSPRNPPPVLSRAPLLPGPPTICQNHHHYCQQECVDGFSLCRFHILEDRSAPFRPCSYVHANGNKCGAPVPRKDNQPQCEEHRRRMLRARQRADRVPPPPESLDLLAEQLRQNQAQDATTSEPSAGDTPWEGARRALQRPDSDSDSEAEGDRMAESPLELSSDDGFSAVSDDEVEPLRTAGVFTDEEVVRIAEQRLVRLQRLYMGQFQRLRHVIAHKRRSYLLDVAREKETMKSICGATRETPAERQAFEELRAFGHHQKPAGKDYLFWHHRNEKRAREAGKTARQSAYARCSHGEGRVRCGARTVPLSKFCLKHILEDPHQVLFRACGGSSSSSCGDADGDYTAGGEPCSTAIPAILPDARCPLHVQISQPLPVRMPEEPDPMEAVFGLSAAGDDVPLDETQSRLVATIANSLLAAAGIDGAGGIGGGAVQASETNSEVDVIGDGGSETGQVQPMDTHTSEVIRVNDAALGVGGKPPSVEGETSGTVPLVKAETQVGSESSGSSASSVVSKQDDTTTVNCDVSVVPTLDANDGGID